MTTAPCLAQCSRPARSSSVGGVVLEQLAAATVGVGREAKYRGATDWPRVTASTKASSVIGWRA